MNKYQLCLNCNSTTYVNRLTDGICNLCIDGGNEKRKEYYLRKIDNRHTFIQDCAENIRDLEAKGEDTAEYKRVMRETLGDLRYYIDSYLAV